MTIWMVLLLIASAFACFAGLGTLSQATQGVGMIAVACLLGIYARIAQAAKR